VWVCIPALQVGEHDGCGPGNYAASGFSYIPETFMAERIGVYNICWRDMGVPTLDKMMDIVQVWRSPGHTQS
jgi:protein tyrosine phosphatase domain-containing protein 1